MSNFTSSGFNWCERYVGFLKDRNERSPQFVASPGFFLLSGIPDGKQTDLLSAAVIDLCGKSAMEKVCDNCSLVTSYGFRRQGPTILGHCGASYAEQMAMGDWQQVTAPGSSGSNSRSAMPARYTGQKELAAVYVKTKVLAIHQLMAKAGIRQWTDISPAMWEQLGSVTLDKPIDSTVIWRHPDAKPARVLILKTVPQSSDTPEVPWPYHCKLCGLEQPMVEAVLQAGGSCACGGEDFEQRAPLPAGQEEDDRGEVPPPYGATGPSCPHASHAGEKPHHADPVAPPPA